MNQRYPQLPYGNPVFPPKAIAGLLALAGLLVAATQVAAVGFWNGRQIMEEVNRRHQQFPYVYEEHSIVMVDSMGQRDTRQAKRYSRIEDNGEMKLLYIFETPPEVKGVTLMAQRNQEGITTALIYLPALGANFLESSGTGSGGNFLGTDFSIEDLTVENLRDYEYERVNDEKIEELDYFVIDVYPVPDQTHARQRLRRHYIRQDNFYITRTDHFDRQGLLHKQQSCYDLKKTDEEMWRAGIILMDDIKQKHQSLIKINRRVFSEDYVPAAMFSKEWILASYPPLEQPREDQNETPASGHAGVNRNIDTSQPGAQDTP